MVRALDWLAAGIGFESHHSQGNLKSNIYDNFRTSRQVVGSTRLVISGQNIQKTKNRKNTTDKIFSRHKTWDINTCRQNIRRQNIFNKLKKNLKQKFFTGVGAQ